MRVVLADDEHVIREGLRNHIDWHAMGCELVGTAQDGEEAIELVCYYHPEIVITDIRMPEMNGLELIQAINEQSPRTVIIVLSAFSEFDFARQAMNYGVRSYLLKPINKEELEHAIRKAIDDYRHLFSNETPLGSEVNEIDISVDVSTIRHSAIRSTVQFLLERHTDPNITLQQTASEIVFLNSDYLGRLFRNETGLSFSSFLSRIRIAHAKKLIEMKPSLTNTELSVAVGYGDHPGYFSSAFSKVAGMSVREFKASRSNQDRD